MATEIKRVWFPHKAYFWVEPKIYDRKWFWPGQKVSVTKHRIREESRNPLLLFSPFLILAILTGPSSKVVDFYEVLKWKSAALATFT